MFQKLLLQPETKQLAVSGHFAATFLFSKFCFEVGVKVTVCAFGGVFSVTALAFKDYTGLSFTPISN